MPSYDPTFHTNPTFDPSPAPRYRRGAFPIMMLTLVLSVAALLCGALPGCATSPQGGGFDLAAFVTQTEAAVLTGVALYGQLNAGALVSPEDAARYGATLDKLEAALTTAAPFLPAATVTLAQRIIADGRAVLLGLSAKSTAKSAPDWAAKIADLNALNAAVPKG